MNTIFDSIDRVRKMEEIFDELSDGILEDPPRINGEQLKILINYYEGGEWRQDFELDEAGLLPRDLKRGVLSEDGVYDLFETISEVAKKR